ncbi:hypothetical protein [Ammoniphilus resinae]|uniref:Transposase n=1 Tax=Ammoniphilus resinae TaxID=861532 RepID=A0ABS4GNL8_9BACL|nr:hypothetical protein [Ammoniphilus resinae]MBP1931836.1 hypothetical protein [Ammoniphilus resinae]
MLRLDELKLELKSADRDFSGSCKEPEHMGEYLDLHERSVLNRRRKFKSVKMM